MEGVITMRERSDSVDQINRVWEHKLHVEDNFYNRLNFFLVFESILLSSVVSVVFSKPSSGKIVLIIAILLGLTITSLWGYVQARQKHILENLRIRLKNMAPEYKETVESREKWPVSSMGLLTYVVPSIIGLLWMTLLIFLLLS
jgi:hypothetical protein